MDIVGIKRFLNKNKDKTLDEIISESVVNGIGNVIGNSDSPAGTDTLFGLLKRGFVKSVQIIKIRYSQINYRQDLDSSVGVNYMDATISPTNVSKTIVFPFTSQQMYGTREATDSYNYYSPLAWQIAKNKIRIAATSASGSYPYVNKSVVYVVEFY